MRHPQCSLFHPGHQVHHIQARKVAEVLHPASGDLGRFAPVELTDLGGGWFEAGVDGETRLGWNHSLDDVAAFARDSVLGEVLFIPELSALVCVRGQFDPVASQRRLLYPSWGKRNACAPVNAAL
ncbi:hypothetical protein [Corynebacterium sp.]|jgi:hypothetical protein|uniref:hypothetical protein n=1 Tax=Corynebacterium sp. TaxID=1720 RepID=UPI0025B882DD|nr:hypothetical protein [Corynebacterium sp.]